MASCNVFLASDGLLYLSGFCFLLSKSTKRELLYVSSDSVTQPEVLKLEMIVFTLTA